MLGARDATATIAVKDIDRARRFYEGTLGLKLVDAEEPDALVFRSGSSMMAARAGRREWIGLAVALAAR